MKTIFSFAVVVLFLVVSSPCWAEMSVENVSPKRAQELGVAVRGTANGPKQAWIQLEFKPAGTLKEFQHVSLEIRDGDHFLLGWTPLQARRLPSGAVQVSLMADRVFLKNISLRIVTGATDDAGHDLRIQNFVDLEKLR